jgi:hypothetical protein
LAWHLRLLEAEFRGIVQKRAKFTQRREVLRKSVSANVKIAKRPCSINKKTKQRNKGKRQNSRAVKLCWFPVF